MLKGGVEPGETHLQALKRELWEETRIRRVESIAPTRLELVFTDRVRGATAHMKLFLVRVPWDIRVKVGGRPVEHSSFRWATRAQALRMLTYRNQRQLLARATKKMPKK